MKKMFALLSVFALMLLSINPAFAQEEGDPPEVVEVTQQPVQSESPPDQAVAPPDDMSQSETPVTVETESAQSVPSTQVSTQESTQTTNVESSMIQHAADDESQSSQVTDVSPTQESTTEPVTRSASDPAINSTDSVVAAQSEGDQPLEVALAISNPMCGSFVLDYTTNQPVEVGISVTFSDGSPALISDVSIDGSGSEVISFTVPADYDGRLGISATVRTDAGVIAGADGEAFCEIAPTEEPTTEPTQEPTEEPTTEPTEPGVTEPPIGSLKMSGLQASCQDDGTITGSVSYTDAESDSFAALLYIGSSETEIDADYADESVSGSGVFEFGFDAQQDNNNLTVEVFWNGGQKFGLVSMTDRVPVSDCGSDVEPTEPVETPTEEPTEEPTQEPTEPIDQLPTNVEVNVDCSGNVTGSFDGNLDPSAEVYLTGDGGAHIEGSPQTVTISGNTFSAHFDVSGLTFDNYFAVLYSTSGRGAVELDSAQASGCSTATPTETPTQEPTEEPTEPTETPTEEPTTEPTSEPTEEPTTPPTDPSDNGHDQDGGDDGHVDDGDGQDGGDVRQTAEKVMSDVSQSVSQELGQDQPAAESTSTDEQTATTLPDTGIGSSLEQHSRQLLPAYLALIAIVLAMTAVGIRKYSSAPVRVKS